jgi:hypothetical protein
LEKRKFFLDSLEPGIVKGSGRVGRDRRGGPRRVHGMGGIGKSVLVNRIKNWCHWERRNGQLASNI